MSNTGKCFSFMCGCGLQNISVQHSVLSYLGQFWILILSVPGNDHNLSNRGVMMQSKLHTTRMFKKEYVNYHFILCKNIHSKKKSSQGNTWTKILYNVKICIAKKSSQGYWFANEEKWKSVVYTYRLTLQHSLCLSRASVVDRYQCLWIFYESFKLILTYLNLIFMVGVPND